MHILITGAAGMIGRKLIEQLIVDRALNRQPIEKLNLMDIVAPTRPAGFADHVKVGTGGLADPAIAMKAVSERPDVIFHLAGVVSGEAELNLEKGHHVNLAGTGSLREAIRKTGDGYKPRVIFTSSIAVFGAPFPHTIPDEFHLTPLTSYGAQKVMCEQMLADYTRKGILEGVGIRLPSIVVRPGKPNKAASGFFSGIIREPLAGAEAVLPVAETVVHTHASPRSAVGVLVYGAELPRAQIEPHINLTMPGVCCTVGEQIEALRRVAGDKVASRIRREPDPLVVRIVGGWPQRLAGERATELGFT